jgi:uncharacterized protein YbaP (TraB family)
MLAYKAMPSCDTATSGVDEQLMTTYTKLKKDIYGLETIGEQMDFITKSGMIDPEVLIKSLKQFDEMKGIYVDLADDYSEENIRDLFLLIATPNEYTTQQDVEKMLDFLLLKRNTNWVAKIPSIAKEKQTFFGVGAGHLGGDIGVINLLRKQGYTVEAVMD